jgi:hypothetical protein
MPINRPSKRPPKRILYKYRTINTQNIETIFSNTIYFSSPEDFNDPFDSRISIEECDTTEMKRLRILLESLYPQIPIDNNSTDIDIENTNAFSDILLDENVLECLRYISTVESLEKSIQVKVNKLGIFCLSETDRNPLMWSHYSDGHKGFCIGYEINEIDGDYKLHQVKYCGQPVISSTGIDESFLRADEDFPDDTTKDIVSKKLAEWSYEKEVRIVKKFSKSSNFDKKEHKRLQPAAKILTIREIIFGIRCPVWFIELIYSSASIRPLGISLYNIKKERDSFVRVAHDSYREEMGLELYEVGAKYDDDFNDFD